MRRPARLVISATVFVDLLGFTLILPALPFYASSLGATGLWFGALMSAYSVAQLVAAPVLGRLSDRYGRRPLVLLALAGSVVSMTFTGLATSLAGLLVCRMLAGACGGSISVAQAYLADAVPAERRTGAMAQLGAAIGLAFVVGPALGGVLAPFGFAACAYAAAALAAINLGAAIVWLPEPARRPPAGPHGTPTRPRQGAGRVSEPFAVRRRPVALLAGTQFLAMAAFVGMETTLAFLGRDRYGWDATAIGLALAAAGLAMAVVQAGLVAWLARRWGDGRVAAAGAVLMAGCMGAVAGSATWWQCLAAVCLLAAGHGLLTPTVASLLAAAGPPEQRGARMGTGQSAGAAARIAGPAAAGLLFDAGAALPYVAGAVSAVLAAVAVLAVPALEPAGREEGA
ncbi:MFS transporter, DHA1 family, tetracycline resistance protein [Nonomuraea solani]|uniref:MFS transporter, DHA1 family, tetracycline resistance protein n=1 Tax=Nonomuraea solani TaxID=1144553 RepID=A0A1H6EWG4_9ACTN|nr:MFS transporter [Nonomuraea solani]SEH02187.1 MFS transporter, DHA1 family, tetracycline resistance protein [Nonomuraea solani]